MAIDTEEEEIQNGSCDVCGKVENVDTIDDRWITFGVGNDADEPLYVHICPDCSPSDENLHQALDVFIEHLRKDSGN